MRAAMKPRQQRSAVPLLYITHVFFQKAGQILDFCRKLIFFNNCYYLKMQRVPVPSLSNAPYFRGIAER
jgi:hypothetical protein